jgi:hypothetical protein
VHTKSSLLGSKCDCRVTVELNIDKSYLQKSEKEGGNEDWKTIKTFLDLFGFESKFVHVSVFAPPAHEMSQEPDNKTRTVACNDKRVNVARLRTSRTIKKRDG